MIPTMQTVVKALLFILIVEIFLIGGVIYASSLYNLDGIGLFIWSILGLFVVYPAAIVTNVIAVAKSNNCYLYVPLGLNTLGAISLLLYIALS